LKGEVGLILFGILGIGLLLLLTRRGGSNYYEPLHPASSFKFLPPEKPRGRRYKNTETWDIEWNTDGLPSKVTIHRNAVQE